MLLKRLLHAIYVIIACLMNCYYSFLPKLSIRSRYPKSLGYNPIRNSFVNLQPLNTVTNKSIQQAFVDFNRNEIDVLIESPSMNSRKITASIVIDGTIEDVWSILTDYNNLSKHVPNLVKSYLIPSPTNSIRLFQEGAQKIIGFDFRASVTMDMTEEPIDETRALQERRLNFKLVDSIMFSSFEGNWTMKYMNRIQKFDPINNITLTSYKTLLLYSVYVKPKGVVPVFALEWRIKEDIPPNLRGIKLAAETLANNRRSLNRKNPSNSYGDSSNNYINGWRPDETLGRYLIKSRRLANS